MRREVDEESENNRINCLRLEKEAIKDITHILSHFYPNGI